MKNSLVLLITLLSIGGPFTIDVHAQRDSQPRVITAFSASTLGFGVQAALRVTAKSDIQGGFNLYNYDRSFRRDGADYSGQLRLGSFNLQYDQYLVAGLHISGGALVWNGNKGDAAVSVPGGQLFKLGGVTYFSDTTSPVAGTSTLRFRKAAPMALVGYGNLLSKGHIAYSVDAGVVFQGTPRTTLSLAGSACPIGGGGAGLAPCPDVATIPAFQSHLAAEQARINDDLAPLKYYPVIKFTIGYKF